MKNIFFSFIPAVCVLFDPGKSVSANKSPFIDGKFEDLADSLDAFTPSLYHAVAMNYGQNLFLSPFSIANVLSMIYLGAKGNTARQLEETLKISLPGENIHYANKEYLNHLPADNKNVIFKSANRIYANQNLSISNTYKTKLINFYNSKIESVNFNTKAAKTNDAINEWIEQFTNGKIKNLTPENILSPDTLLVLINLIYFKGIWEEKFPKIATKRRDFFLNSMKTVQRETMYLNKEFNFKKDANLNCQILELTYVGKNLSMFIVLPDKIDGLSLLEKKLSPDFFHDLMERKGFEKTKLDAYLPKFRLESTFELKDILSKMGLTELLDGEKCDLSAMVNEGKQNKIYVSKFMHKTFVEVNEEGTETATETRLVLQAVSAMVYPQFNANRPFLVTIVDNRMMIPLFLGRVKDPQI